MHSSGLLALAATVASVSAAAIQGFNYGAQHTDGSAKIQSEFENEFTAAHELAGTDGAFTSARLYTMIQHGTEGDIISAIPAAIKTKTRLLLGMWASAGQTVITNEINALEAAVEKYGDDFTSLIDGISVGSEDLYRVTPTSQKNEPGSVGASPDALVSYIKQVREAIKGTSLSDASIGHVDTWTAWVNGSNSEVVDACDWVGTDAYPYFQTEMTNSITNGQDLFQEAFDQTKAFSNGKPVWVTETGWPIAGAKKNLAVAGTKEAEIYWQKVGCELLFGSVNTWWYTLSDASPDTPNPTFGILGADLENTPAYDLTCSPKSKSSTKSATGSAKTASSKASASKGLDSTVSQTAGSPAITTGASASGGSGSPGSNATAASTFLASTAVPTAASGTGAATPVATGAAVAKAASVGVVMGAVMVAVAAL